MSTEINMEEPISVYQASFIWEIPNYRLKNTYSEKFNLGGMNLIIDLTRGFLEKFDSGNTIRFHYQKPIFSFESVKFVDRKFAKVLITSSKGEATSYLPYSEITSGKQSFNEINYRFLDSRNVSRCLTSGYTLTLFIDVSIKGAPHHEQFNKSNKLAKDLSSLLTDHTLADFTFVVGDRDFPVHKGIVSARSPVFRFIVTKGDNKSELKNIEPDVFSSLIHFLYTDNIPDLNQHFIKLLELAHQFNIDDLKDICEVASMARLNESNVVDIFQLAYHQNCERLKQAAFNMIQKIFEKLNMKMPVQLVTKPDTIKKLITLKTEMEEFLEPIEAVTIAETRSSENRSRFPLKIKSYGYNSYARKPSSFVRKPKADTRSEKSEKKMPGKMARERSENAEDNIKKSVGGLKKGKHGSKKQRDERNKENAQLPGGPEDHDSREPVNENSGVSDPILSYTVPIANLTNEEPRRFLYGITLPPIVDGNYSEEVVQVSDNDKPKVKEFYDFVDSLSD